MDLVHRGGTCFVLSHEIMITPLKARVSIGKSTVSVRVQVTNNIKVSHELESAIAWITIWRRLSSRHCGRLLFCATEANFYYDVDTRSDTELDPE